MVRVQLTERLGCILNNGPQVLVTGDNSSITHLPAAFGIKGGLVGQDDDLVPCLGSVNTCAILDQRNDHTFAVMPGVTGEFGRALVLVDVKPQRGIAFLTGPGPGRPRRPFLFSHRGCKAGLINRKPLRAQGILGQVIGKTKGVIEFERHGSGQCCARFHRCRRFIKQAQSVGQRLAKPGFLKLQRLLDQRLGAHQFRIGRPHLPDQRRNQPVHQRFLGAQQMRMPHRPPHDPPQHIPAPFVGRQHAIGNEETAGPQMISNHPVGRSASIFRIRTGQRFRRFDQRPKSVGIIIVGHALQHGGNPLQPHAGVDARRGQVQPGGGIDLLILHEHQIPDFNEPVAVLVG